MNNLYRFSLVAGIYAATACAENGGKMKQSAAENTLCLHFYNAAAVPSETAEHASLAVSRAFRRAGIRMSWEHPPSDSEEAHVLDLNDSVGSFRSKERPCLVLKIVSDLPAGAYHGALGFALPRSRFGIHVELVYRRIELQAASAGVATDVVLAYVMAHEIGHVLLDSSFHSSAGIMRPKPDAESWRLASLGMMEFLPDQSKQMRKQLFPPKQLTFSP